MAWELRAIVLGGIFLLGAAPPPAVSVDLNAPAPPSLMTGTVAERNEKINALLEGKYAQVEQMSFQSLGFGTMVMLFGTQTRIDFRPDWPALEKVGVTPDTLVSLNLFHVTQPQVLRAALAQIRPPKGQLDFKLKDGAIAIVPVDDETPPRETEADKKSDLAVAKLLKEPLDAGEILNTEQTFAQALNFLNTKKKLNLTVDWRELKVVDVTPDSKITLKATDRTGEGYLNALFATLKPVGGTVGYEFRWGLLRITTAERLAKEKKLLDAAEKVAGDKALP